MTQMGHQLATNQKRWAENFTKAIDQPTKLFNSITK